MFRVVSSDRSGAVLAVESVTRRDALLTVALVLTNGSASAARLATDTATTSLGASDGSTHQLRRDPSGGPVIANAPAGGDGRFSLEFDVAAEARGPFRLLISTPPGDTVSIHFPALVFNILQ